MPAMKILSGVGFDVDDDALPLTPALAKGIREAFSRNKIAPALTDDEVRSAHLWMAEAVGWFKFYREAPPRLQDALAILDSIADAAAHLDDALKFRPGESVHRVVYRHLRATTSDADGNDQLDVFRNGIATLRAAIEPTRERLSEAAISTGTASHFDVMLTGIGESIFAHRRLARTVSSSYQKVGMGRRKKWQRKSLLAAVVADLLALLPKPMQGAKLVTLTERHKTLVPDWKRSIIASLIRNGHAPNEAGAKRIAEGFLSGELDPNDYPYRGDHPTEAAG